VRRRGRRGGHLPFDSDEEAALIALHALETEGVGQIVDLSAQEAVARSLENAVRCFDLERVVRSRAGAGPQGLAPGCSGARTAGSTWSAAWAAARMPGTRWGS
jgi:crotonobetainyl-CoA:carnitine CoA-transferase CaiB-like acyl-CoA transferase